MTKRFFLSIALGALAAFALGVAAPAYACGKDCDCTKKAASDKVEKKDAKPAEKPAAGDKKAEAAPCKCEKGGKGCTCEKGKCKCENCGQAKFADAEKCKCEKGGKGCTCEKGKCNCENCGKAKFADAEKCKCEKGGKGCTCEKGKCKCENCGKTQFKSAA